MSTPTTLTTPASAKHIFEAVVLTALSDGTPQYEETRLIADLVTVHPIFEKLPNAQEVGLAIWKRFREVGIETCIAEVAARISERTSQELAFQLCGRVMGADGETAGEEAMLLGTLQESFGLSPADVRRLLQGD